ncbi:hypothetical protein [Streptococcus tangpeifui]|uniref:hypothetical protein n=1 Tax=Streptococcus tangpeifui TaxID=2709400 RepID=UPI001F14FB82|nr:hypothetical protein [Streptococcus sp. ZJ373]
MMKKRTALLVSLLTTALLILAGCGISKSDLQGEWQVQDSAGNNMTMTVTSKSLKVDGDSITYKYAGKGTVNGNRYLSITVKGEDYTIFFPEKDKKTALMIQPTDNDDKLKGELVMVMNKTKKPDYEDYAKKYMKGIDK